MSVTLDARPYNKVRCLTILSFLPSRFSFRTLVCLKAPNVRSIQRFTLSSNESEGSSALISLAPVMRFSSGDSELIASLHALSIKSPKLVHSSTYAAPDDPTIEIQSWKMNEFKYYDVPSPFPTLARGLFSMKVKEKNRVGSRIVVRGYDKFFNIGEVPWTTVSSLLEILFKNHSVRSTVGLVGRAHNPSLHVIS